eukprot:CAMPEP_0176301902 /NCGR_PEP_ID=MMETSP0121_2-20121125/61100_1 /TAXON_ID=160619 /ORGANISM="Kryptoperidinium foliaceum, Strain CCMP 1326" /LENGTH=233 /DNA_ID=CAMNT_0017643383 /DNA_START=56 /DNA_END=754 /DNA_ORIENTATION=-
MAPLSARLVAAALLGTVAYAVVVVEEVCDTGAMLQVVGPSDDAPELSQIGEGGDTPWQHQPAIGGRYASIHAPGSQTPGGRAFGGRGGPKPRPAGPREGLSDARTHELPPHPPADGGMKHGPPHRAVAAGGRLGHRPSHNSPPSGGHPPHVPQARPGGSKVGGGLAVQHHLPWHTRQGGAHHDAMPRPSPEIASHWHAPAATREGSVRAPRHAPVGGSVRWPRHTSPEPAALQ